MDVACIGLPWYRFNEHPSAKSERGYLNTIELEHLGPVSAGKVWDNINDAGRFDQLLGRLHLAVENKSLKRIEPSAVPINYHLVVQLGRISNPSAASYIWIKERIFDLVGDVL